jgi:hypothetical protein
MTRSIYDPASYPQGVPNPWGPRVHAWNGGPWDQGTRYHGSVWTRPQWNEAEYAARPFAGVGAVGPSAPAEIPQKCWSQPGFASCYERVLNTAWDWCEEPVADGSYPRWQEQYGSAEACANINANKGTKDFCAQHCKQLARDPNLPYYAAAAGGLLLIAMAMHAKKGQE